MPDEDLNMAESIGIMITGYTGSDHDYFITWLNRKSHMTFQPTNIRYEDRVLYFEVPSQRIASALCRLSGYTFMDRELTIELVDGNSTQQIQPRLSTIDTLRVFLESRWQAETKYLNLDKVEIDPILKNAGIRGFGYSPNHKFGPATMKLAASMFEEIHSISFANNRLRSVQPISTVAQFLPKIQNLSLQDNDIQAFTGLEALTGPGKLKELRELVLTGNPFRDKEIGKSGDDVAYRSEITRRFPSLKMLDGVAVTPMIQFDIPEADILSKKEVRLPATVKGQFFDSELTRNAAMDFVGKYFATFDTNRATLLDLYDPNALFSVSVNTMIPPAARHRRWDPKPDWGGWTGYSRNLSRIKEANRRFQTIHHGSSAIIGVLTKLPLTSHDQKAPEKFCIDAWQLKGYEAAAASGQADQSGVVLFVTVHGEFSEGPGKIMRSFDRTFIVAPSADGSKAQHSGWSYVILSDQFIVRTHVGHEAWQPPPIDTTITVPPTAAMPTTAIPPQNPVPERMVGLSDFQHSMALELMRRTNLNYPFATQCLLDNGWDMNRGLEAFERLKAANSIPLQAWIS